MNYLNIFGVVPFDACVIQNCSVPFLGDFPSTFLLLFSVSFQSDLRATVYDFCFFRFVQVWLVVQNMICVSEYCM